MIKIAVKVLSFLLLTMSIHPLCAEYQSSVEVRAAAFFHSSARFREIYGNVGTSYGMETSSKLCHAMDGWVNFDWFSKRGKSVGFDDSTRANIANVSFGVKFPCQLSEQCSVYIGVGASLARIWLHNKSQCTHQSTSKLAVGGVLKTGVCYFFNHCMFINVFLDYLYQPANFKTHVDIGGLKTGAGLGFQF